MRDVTLTIAILGTIPLIFWRPWLGILVWYWIGIMNPHRHTWGFANDFPFAVIIGAVTLLAFLIRGEKKLPMNGTVALMLLFTLFTCFTWIFALAPEAADTHLERFLKIQIFTFLTLFLINSRQRLDALILVATASLAFYGAKGGLFIVTGNTGKVWGPPDSFIGDNNALALAMVMVLPLMRYFQLNRRDRWQRNLVLGTMLLTVFAVLGTFSRGGFLALSAAGCYLLLRSRRRITLGIAVAVAIVGAIQILPQAWFDRMETMLAATEGQERTVVEAGRSIDESVSGRFDSWQFAINLANDRPLIGGGFGVFGNQRIFDIYNPEAAKARSAHSIWFQVVGEHGWLGFLIYLALWISLWLQLGRTRRRLRGRQEFRWLRDLAEMLRVSMFAFAVAGTFLDLAVFDLFWLLVSISVICDSLSRQAVEAGEVQGSVARTEQQAGPAPSGGGLSGFLAKRE